MKEAVAGLEEEEATLAVEIIRCYTKDTKSLAFPQEFLFSGIHPMMRGCLVLKERKISKNLPGKKFSQSRNAPRLAPASL